MAEPAHGHERGANGNSKDAPDGEAPRRNWKMFLLRLLGSAVLLSVLFLVLPLDQLWDALSGVTAGTWVIAIGTYLCLHSVGAMKWRMVVNTAGAGITPLQAIRFYYAGLFGNTFLPSIVGGDMVRAGLALRYARSKAGLLLGSVIDRGVDIIGLAGVAGIGVLLIPSALDEQSRRIFIGLAGLLAIAFAGLATLVLLLPGRRFPFRIRRRIVKVRAAARAFWRKRHIVLASLALGMALQTSLILLTAWLGRAVGLETSVRIWLFVWPLAKISGLLPVTQGGLGVREAAHAALFAPFGVPPVLAVAVSLVFQAVIISGGLIGGALAFLLGRVDRRGQSEGAMAGRAMSVPGA